jgi:hypothetical protein
MTVYGIRSLSDCGKTRAPPTLFGKRQAERSLVPARRFEPRSGDSLRQKSVERFADERFRCQAEEEYDC